ncbi:MAG: 4-(cytidine 5'-diphospho)-2-C-methyl-D-erythritol kinase [Paramuribaculum sp.]|nr:4-(cytidine 5'-diphospho)-2-C-methyl-D-erythritol kinase [Paramuribaculum sp.]
MILFPNCKINLGLDIIERRSDGYHNISSVMAPVAWTDILEIVPSASGKTTLTVTGNAIACEPEKNLVMKAVNLLSLEADIPPVDIFLRKVIPDGAGLGGGSADASFTLIGLNRMFSLGFSDDQLAEIAAGIGADCPFFIYNNVCEVSGIGTTITPLPCDPLAGLWIAIVKPAEGVSTREAYAGVTPHIPARLPAEIVMSAPPSRWESEGLKNDFEATVATSRPAIARAISTIRQMGALYTSMSGSGAAVYGLFDSADNLSARLEAAFPGHDIFVGKASPGSVD